MVDNKKKYLGRNQLTLLKRNSVCPNQIQVQPRRKQESDQDKYNTTQQVAETQTNNVSTATHSSNEKHQSEMKLLRNQQK